MEVSLTLSNGSTAVVVVDTSDFDPRVRTFGGDYMKVRLSDGSFFVAHDHATEAHHGLTIGVPSGLTLSLVYGRPTYESEVVTDQMDFGDEDEHPQLYYKTASVGDKHTIELRAAVAAPAMYVMLEFMEARQ